MVAQKDSKKQITVIWGDDSKVRTDGAAEGVRVAGGRARSAVA